LRSPLLRIIQGGMLTTVQDKGRYGHRRCGVPVSGAVDSWSLKVANVLIGNGECCAGLEITVLGPRIEFCRDTSVSICGGNLSPLLDGDPVHMWQGVKVRRGQLLSFGGRVSGCRAYLAVAGGIDVPEVMGSRSTYLRGATGGFGGRALMDGDILYGGETQPAAGLLKLNPDFRPDLDRKEWELRVIMGPQDHYFTGEALEVFLSEHFTVSLNSDRMGIRLEGRVLDHKDGADILSEAVAFGSVQVPAHGRPIVLMAESQTTGGYAKIANVITADHSFAAQCVPGDKIRFRSVTLEFAHRLLHERETGLKRGLVTVD